MAKIKDALIDEQIKRNAGIDLSYEHETHNTFVDNCYECSKAVNTHTCKLCGDTGVIEIYGGSTADDWGPIDSRPCGCQLTQD